MVTTGGTRKWFLETILFFVALVKHHVGRKVVVQRGQVEEQQKVVRVLIIVARIRAQSDPSC